MAPLVLKALSGCRLTAAAAVLVALLAGGASASAATSFTITGHGYGHGVGMSQFGAQGYAQHGMTYDAILAHYYTGTHLGNTTVSTIRVALQEGRTGIRLRSTTGLTITDEGSSGGAPISITPNTTVGVSGTTGAFTLATDSGAQPATGLVGPILVQPAGSDPVTLLGAAENGATDGTYAGAIRVIAVKAGLDAVNVVKLDDYVRGVVPSEMPSSWLPAALEAQAVAARSYAVATRKAASAPFDAFSDTRSQVYRGVGAQQPATDAAVAATAGQVVLYGSAVAVTYFSSTSGGRTADPQEAGLTTAPVPYLVPVDDPYDSISPYHDWTAVVTADAAAKALSYAGTVDDLSVVAYPSGRAQTLVVDGSAGQVSVAAGTARTALGLRSTWFSVAQPLTLAPAVVSAGSVHLTGTVGPGVQVTLQAGSGTSFKAVATLAADETGTVSATRPLGEAPSYRLKGVAGLSNVVIVSAGSGLSLHARSGNVFNGRLYPALAQRLVVLQRLRSGRWRSLTHVRSDAAGHYRFTLRTRPPGTYRTAWAGDPIFRGAVSPLARVGIAKPSGGPIAYRRLSGTVASSPTSWVPTDPEYPDQWYLTATHAFDYFTSAPLGISAEPIRVAVVDGGIDARSPDLRLAKGQALPGDRGSVVVQTVDFGHAGTATDLDHGTAVAGIIAAQVDNGIGIAGMAPSVRLLDVRVVGPNGGIDPVVEAQGIHWAVDHGARVINLSFAATRDPKHPAYDEHSTVEENAIDYAYANGAVIVAPTGNSTSPYPYASYPAALPHVLGVSAIDKDRHTPSFSNRDPVYNDLAAPGVGLVTTVSRATDRWGLSEDAPQPNDIVQPDGTVQGTSFAAPQVSAAAATLLTVNPALTNSQVMEILESSADTLEPIPPDSPRNPDTGLGLLDVNDALVLADQSPPPPDSREPNDTVATATPLPGARSVVRGTVDAGDDPIDAYRVFLIKGQILNATLDPLPGQPAADLSLLLWRPGTKDLLTATQRQLVAFSQSPSPHERIAGFIAPTSGNYTLEVSALPTSSGAYRLVVSRAPTA
jgi:stage II sporulation protein D